VKELYGIASEAEIRMSPMKHRMTMKENLEGGTSLQE